MKKPIRERDVRKWCVDQNALRHIALYCKTRNGLEIWRAYQEYRHAGLPVPEAILAKFDVYAKRLKRAGSAKEVAQAIEMAAAKGGPAGATLAKGQERQRDVVEYVRDRREATPTRDLDAIFAEAAKRFHSTVPTVRTYYFKWMRVSSKS